MSALERAEFERTLLLQIATVLETAAKNLREIGREEHFRAPWGVRPMRGERP